MNCRHCGATYTMIASTNPVAGDRVVRERKCVECKKCFSTIEIYTEIHERLEGQAWHFQNIISPESRSKAKAAIDKVMIEHGG